VESLLASGVPVDGQGVNCYTPLAFALRARNLDGVQVLLKHGADPNHQIATPAALGGYPIILVLPIHASAPFLEALLRAGANPNTRMPMRPEQVGVFPYEGENLLSLAFMHIDNVKVLVKYGADVNLRPQEGKGTSAIGGSAIMHAARLGQLEVVNYLLEHGARDLDEAADALQSSSWSPDFRPRVVVVLRRLHAMGAKVYSGYKPILGNKVSQYIDPPAPPELLTPGYYAPTFFTGDKPLTPEEISARQRFSCPSFR